MLYISYPGRVHAQRWWTQARPCTVSEKAERGMLCIAVGVWDPRDVTEKPQIQFSNWKRLLEGVLRGINGSMPLSELVIDMREREVSNTDSAKNMEFMCWNIFWQLDLNYSLYFSRMLPGCTDPELWWGKSNTGRSQLRIGVAEGTT